MLKLSENVVWFLLGCFVVAVVDVVLMGVSGFFV